VKALVLSLENTGTIYLLHNSFFANFEFIFAIKFPKLAREGIKKYNEHNTK